LEHPLGLFAGGVQDERCFHGECAPAVSSLFVAEPPYDGHLDSIVSGARAAGPPVVTASCQELTATAGYTGAPPRENSLALLDPRLRKCEEAGAPRRPIGVRPHADLAGDRLVVDAHRRFLARADHG